MEQENYPSQEYRPGDTLGCLQTGVGAACQYWWRSGEDLLIQTTISNFHVFHTSQLVVSKFDEVKPFKDAIFRGIILTEVLVYSYR